MTTITRSQSSLLFNALLANTIFSFFSGLLMSLAPATVAGWLGSGIVAADVQSLGFGLLLFAGWLAFISIRRQVGKYTAWLIVAADLSWVLSSVVLLASQSSLFSTLGIMLVADVAAVVLLFALLQAKGIRQTG